MFKFLCIFLVVQAALAISCPNAKPMTEIVSDIIRLDLEGIRYDFVSEKCLKQESFKNALISKDISNEIPPEIAYIVNDEKDFKVLEIKEVDKETHTYEVNVEITALDKLKNMTTKSIVSYRFFLYKDEVSRNNYGCFGVIKSPEKLYLLKRCIRP